MKKLFYLLIAFQFVLTSCENKDLLPVAPGEFKSEIMVRDKELVDGMKIPTNYPIYGQAKTLDYYFFEWDFGNGKKFRDENFSYAYDKPGKYTIKLRYKGADQKEHLQSWNVEVFDSYIFKAEIETLYPVYFVPSLKQGDEREIEGFFLRIYEFVPPINKFDEKSMTYNGKLLYESKPVLRGTNPNVDFTKSTLDFSDAKVPTPANFFKDPYAKDNVYAIYAIYKGKNYLISSNLLTQQYSANVLKVTDKVDRLEFSSTSSLVNYFFFNTPQ